MHPKYQRLCKLIESKGSALVAFSGGIDSTLLAKAASDALGDKAAAVTIDSSTLPRRELKDAKRTAREIGIKHIIVKHDELNNKDFRKNSQDRCYYCKYESILVLKKISKELGFNSILFGVNRDDLQDYRPGHRALSEGGTCTPLLDLAITKDEVRELARELRLPNCDKPQMACLSSRIPYGEEITQEKLRMVEEAEEFVMDSGIEQIEKQFGKGAIMKLG
ncbi:MAG: ATP-dependent sacrificial sulfur transferase LarE, partial [Candidatus Altiarchaeota archaeon]|nr:ATP-dependent sacrificial sulfur transferase LarE [Candidatus Altiarchaeota archaeon]